MYTTFYSSHLMITFCTQRNVVVISGAAETHQSSPGTRLTASAKAFARSAYPKSDLLLKHHSVLIDLLRYCIVHS